jgi:ABC-type thiamine transport system ATPase subunit
MPAQAGIHGNQRASDQPFAAMDPRLREGDGALVIKLYKARINSP